MTGTTPDYPVFLDLHGKRVVVVGAGPVGTRRTEMALAAGAEVHVVAPTATSRIMELSEAGLVCWRQATFVADDLDGAWLAHCATGHAEVDDAVVAAAESRRVWVVRAGDARRSPAWSAATAAVDGVRVAVSGGGDPRRASAVRDAVASALRSGDLPVRRHRTAGHGHVALVGAGPGDPELMTLRGRRLLRSADVVVVDRLVPAAVLGDIDPDVEVIDAGKRPGRHTLTQQEINEVIVHHALRGRRVVRLKGGDPFVLGRGGEEALACLDAGVTVEVVPGVTSALSVPAAAGIPVTHRGVTSSFVVASGHEGLAGVLRQVDAAPADATVVLLMAVAPLAEVAAGLVSAGRRASTPVAVIERGWTDRQRTVTGTLSDIADVVAATGVEPPAVVVVGDVVGLRRWLGDLAAPSSGSGFAGEDPAPAAETALRLGAVSVVP